LISEAKKDKLDQEEEEEIETAMDVEPNQLILKWKYKDVDKKLTFDIDKCIGCNLCKLVCPVDAIEIGPVPEIAQGLLDESNPKIMIDHNKCCYCMLCAIVCPNDAFHEHIAPEGQIDLDQYPHLAHFYEIEEDKCIDDKSNEICQLCLDARKRNRIKDYYKIQQECPTQCFKISSPLSGEVVLKEHMLWKCDPTGCKACVNICPVESFFIPETAEEVKKYGKIACDEDNCIYCGACENSCPDNLIIVERREIKIEDPKKKGHYPWIDGWIRNIKEIITRRVVEAGKDQIEIPVIIEEVKEAKERVEEEVPQLSEEEKKKLQELNEKIQSLLKSSKIRYWIKDGKTEKVGAEVKKVLAQSKA